MSAGFTVFGYWPDSGERYGDFFDTVTARTAEEMMQVDARERGQQFRVCGVLSGNVDAADLYTAFVDPADPRNEDADNLQREPDELEPVTWSVLGLQLDPHDPGWNQRTGGRRYLEHVEALSAFDAEDVARSRAADERSQLVVCAVIRGRVHRADAPYAVFADPDEQPSETHR